MGQDIIIGSGPSGVATASSLLDRGRDVLMLDVGHRMEKPSEDLRHRLGECEPDNWAIADREAATTMRRSERSDTMHPFGSDFLFRAPDHESSWHDASSVHALRPSFAKGGLSNGWGASVLPYRQSDMDGWPLTADDLKPHYHATALLAGIAARRDALADFFPAHAIDVERPLPMSLQSRKLEDILNRSRPALDRLGVSIGASRQAVADGCRQCAMCLYGCPYGLIFQAGDVVDRLVAEQGLDYQAGIYVTGFEESAGGVRVFSGDKVFEGDRLFIATGVLPTALLMLKTMGTNASLVLKDSQHFYLPMLHGWRAGDPAREPHHTLAQQFWEIINPDVDAHSVHVQLYSHNDTYAADMRGRFGALARPMKPAIEWMSRRLIVAQAFLHSDVSPSIGLAMNGDALAFRAIANPMTSAVVGRAARILARAARIGGMLPLTPLLRKGTLGSSFHCGGSLPMRASPEIGETDILGTPHGMRRVHIVDASIFPSIPASTITFTVMANAHRIASNA